MRVPINSDKHNNFENRRYAILCKETWPSWHGDPLDGIRRIMNAAHMDADQFQLGRTKIFIKAPESVCLK